MVLNKKYLTIYFSIFLTVASFSQEEKMVLKDSTVTENLDEVLITATRTIRQLSSLPLPAQIITKNEIREINAIRLNDLLTEQTGLITVPDFGGGEGIQLQGLDAQYTLILIDGMPLVGRLAGTLDLNRITVGNIKQIEIVKGASSSLYGSEALGGVINIITETPKTGFNTDFKSRLGTFNTHDFNTSVNYKKKAFSISTFINRYSSDGYNLTENSSLNTVEPFVNNTFNTKLTYAISERVNVLFSGKYFTQNQDNVASETLQGESDINEWNAHLKVDYTHNDQWNSQSEFYITRYKTEEFLEDEDGERFSDNFYNQLLIRPEIRIGYSPNENNDFIGGIGLNYETLERTSFTLTPEFVAPYLFLQYDGNPTEKLNVILGARFDNHNEYKSQFSPKAALRYELNDMFSVKSSIGYGFKAPDFRQLYFDFTNATVGYTVLGYNAVTTAIPLLESQGLIANSIVPISEFKTSLKPENSVSVNLGMDYKLSSRFKLSLNVFRNNIEDLIDTRVIANKTNGQNVFSYYNVNEVYTQGLEFNTTWKLNNQLKITGGYQLLFAKDKEAENAFERGEVFARETPGSPSFKLEKQDYFGLYNRSRHMGNLKVFYSIPKWKLNTNVRVTYRSKYGLFDTNGNNYLDTYDDFVNGYTVTDFAINKTLYNNYQLGFGIDNIFNFTDTQNITNIPGRIIYGTLNIQI
jgi:outer membrane receptor for ferrienterochelin and colicins